MIEIACLLEEEGPSEESEELAQNEPELPKPFEYPENDFDTEIRKEEENWTDPLYKMIGKYFNWK